MPRTCLTRLKTRIPVSDQDTIEVQCPCGNTHRFAAQFARRVARCPTLKSAFTVPDQSGAVQFLPAAAPTTRVNEDRAEATHASATQSSSRPSADQMLINAKSSRIHTPGNGRSFLIRWRRLGPAIATVLVFGLLVLALGLLAIRGKTRDVLAAKAAEQQAYIREKNVYLMRKSLEARLTDERLKQFVYRECLGDQINPGCESWHTDLGKEVLREYEAWRQVPVSVNRLEALRDYCVAFPESMYTKKAKKELSAIEVLLSGAASDLKTAGDSCRAATKSVARDGVTHADAFVWKLIQNLNSEELKELQRRIIGSDAAAYLEEALVWTRVDAAWRIVPTFRDERLSALKELRTELSAMISSYPGGCFAARAQRDLEELDAWARIERFGEDSADGGKLANLALRHLDSFKPARFAADAAGYVAAELVRLRIRQPTAFPSEMYATLRSLGVQFTNVTESGGSEPVKWTGTFEDVVWMRYKNLGKVGVVFQSGALVFKDWTDPHEIAPFAGGRDRLRFLTLKSGLILAYGSREITFGAPLHIVDTEEAKQAVEYLMLAEESLDRNQAANSLATSALRLYVPEVYEQIRRILARDDLVVQIKETAQIRSLLEPPPPIVIAISSNDRIKGVAGAKVTIVEYADFQ